MTTVNTTLNFLVLGTSSIASHPVVKAGGRSGKLRLTGVALQPVSNAATATNAGVALFYDGIRKVGKLVNTTPNANGEILMRGSTTGLLDQNLVPIAKITRRLAYGFPSSPVLSGGFNRGEDDNTSTNHDATKYTWYLENDSSADYIVLTAI